MAEEALHCGRIFEHVMCSLHLSKHGAPSRLFRDCRSEADNTMCRLAIVGNAAGDYPVNRDYTSYQYRTIPSGELRDALWSVR